MASSGEDVQKTLPSPSIRANVENPNVERHERRLDTLTRLLAAYSECVALSVIDGTLYITANEIDAGIKTNSKEYKNITQILDYFVKIARGEPIEDSERDQAFKNICLQKRFSLTNKKAPGFYITPDVVNKTLELFLSDEKIGRLTFERKFNHLDIKKKEGDMSSKRKYARVAGAIYGQCSELYRDFLKIESSLKKAESKKGSAAKGTKSRVEISETESKEDAADPLTLEEYNAIRSGKYKVLLDEPELQTQKETRQKEKSFSTAARGGKRYAQPEPETNEGQDADDEGERKGSEEARSSAKEKGASDEAVENHVHAEVKLLSHVIDLISHGKISSLHKNEIKIIYFGISKLCCHHCRIMVEQANKVLAGHRLPFKIEVRGRNDLVFGWRPPHRFAEGYIAASTSANAPKKKDIFFEIGFQSRKEVFARDNKLRDVQGRNIQPGASDSDAESVGERNPRKSLQQELTTTLRIIEKMAKKDKTLSNTEKKLEMAVKLHELKGFDTLYTLLINDNIATRSGLNKRLAAIRDALNESLSQSVTDEEFMDLLMDADRVGDEFVEKYKVMVGAQAIPSSHSAAASSSLSPMSVTEKSSYKTRSSQSSTSMNDDEDLEKERPSSKAVPTSLSSSSFLSPRTLPEKGYKTRSKQSSASMDEGEDSEETLSSPSAAASSYSSSSSSSSAVTRKSGQPKRRADPGEPLPATRNVSQSKPFLPSGGHLHIPTADKSSTGKPGPAKKARGAPEDSSSHKDSGSPKKGPG